MANISGAIFTTNSTCTGTNVNIFANKDAVFIDGGPAHTGAAGLPDGEYYVRVTTPGGDLLGTSIGSGDDTPIVVAGGEFSQCYNLSAIVIKASDSSPGYDNTSNPGGEYKVWVSSVNDFDNDSTKTDNFKIKCQEGGDCTVQPPQGTINVIKFYDTNADGVLNGTEPQITGWKVRIQDDIDFTRFTPASLFVAAPDTYTVTEFNPVETNWHHTSTNPVIFSLAVDQTKTVEFGNVCIAGGTGLTLGFWSNKNGQALVASDDLTLLTSLNLVNGAGTSFDPANYAAFRSWILSATATNMAYMLSAQLAAMELNVLNNKVTGGSMVYAPCLIGQGANAFGFISVTDLMNLANASLGGSPNTTAAGAVRTYQECIKNALDDANNNRNFVSATPCAFTFAP
ncbi:MAG TPA: hypothetical protein VJT50_08025 [Pyrinomonadaceae bacterium]|nr:hypothetical protein [Pyrinomonadaceae bacterium]